MTNPTPISTASSSDDLVEKLQARIDQYIPMMGYTGFYTAYDVALDRKILKCLRQPVAGDVVERERIDLEAIKLECDGLEGWAIRRGLDEYYTGFFSDAIKRAILKLIGGGK